jgi:hypothetical protein
MQQNPDNVRLEAILTRDQQKSITEFIELAAKPPDSAPKAPIDVEADAIIRALFVRNPEAAYRMTMLAMAQVEELAKVKTELDDERRSFRGTWLSRLLKRQETLRRSHRRDPRLPIFPQNIRSGNS